MTMDQNRFDAVTRSLLGMPSRRSFLRGLAGAGLAPGVARFPSDTEAGEKRKKKPKRPKPNQYGCLSVGVAGVCTAADPESLTCNNDEDCDCYRTTAGSNFCAGLTPDYCADCRRVADCEQAGYPLGSACIPVSRGHCAGECEGGTARLAPCGYVAPDPE
jgi:hypothetical protein